MDGKVGEYLWKGKPIDQLTHEEAIHAVLYLLALVEDLQSRPVDYRAMARERLRSALRSA